MMMKLIEFTPEGSIVNALMNGPLRYKDLKRVGLSEAWLSRKLRELVQLGMVVLERGHYRLDPVKLRLAFSGEKALFARMIAHEISKNPDILGVVLFGSLARGKKGGDVDLLVLTMDGRFDEGRAAIEMFEKYGVAVDFVHVKFKRLIEWFLDEPPLVFGILSGYEFLFDGGGLSGIFELLDREVRKEWVYLEDAGIWVRKGSFPYTSSHRKST